MDLTMAKLKCMNVQTFLNTNYPCYDVTIVLSLDNDKLHIEPLQQVPKVSNNAKSRIVFKCGLKNFNRKVLSTGVDVYELPNNAHRISAKHFENYGPKCEVTFRKLIDLLRHQKENHKDDKPNYGQKLDNIEEVICKYV